MSRHVIVVGGGIVGCQTALALVERGCRVTIVERNQIASQTSGESSWAGAGILFGLLPWFYAEAVNQLTLRGAALYAPLCQRLADQTGIDPEYTANGMLLLPPYDLHTATHWCSTHGLSATQLPTPAQLGGEGMALHLPRVAQVRPPQLLQALRALLQQLGVSFIEHTALQPLPQIDRLQAWQTTAGDWLEADQFVVTSGAWSFDLLSANASQLDIKPMRGQILLYQQPAQPLQHIVYRDGFYLVPRRDGVLLAGSTLEDVGFDAGVTQEVRDSLIAKAEHIYPALRQMPVLKHWSGLRPGTPNNLPTISAHPAIENLYLNTGHFRYGLTMAPCSAALVADLICGAPPSMDMQPFTLQAA
ncbi:glycine oxidase ThiO [Methylobacillus flagellatus]|uniref:glycine oxidase ThiO n=1 Tax=Methylobacillus flagellatus TaxID=405 RepID=UPI0010F95A4C|nr:glycine oxidase ThiO [Methylobacillus flagellatus]